MGRIAALAVAICCALSSVAAAKPAMWVVRDADSEIYLFGTMHMLDEGADWRTPLFDEVYGRAGTVWVETTVDRAEAKALMRRYGVDPERRLSEKLSPRLMKRLAPVLRKRRMPLASVDSLRPWAAAMVLSVQPMGKRGYSVERGPDVVIARAAMEAAKPVRTFETMEDQFRTLAGLPEEAEVAYLRTVIDDQIHPPPRGLEQAWAEGDLDGLARQMVDDMRRDNPGLYEALLKRRNEAWARTLTLEMRGNGVQLVNVGALHMIGRHGLPALMRQRGFTVERVQ
jgi:uncharacterized protein YbaP (TraB family)